MTASERLKIAGDAAELLEQMGFTAVARLSDDVVTLEFWKRVEFAGYVKPQLARYVFTDDIASARILAETCAARFRAEVERPGDVS